MILREYQRGRAENTQLLHSIGMVFGKGVQHFRIIKVSEERRLFEASTHRSFDKDINISDIQSLFMPGTEKSEMKSVKDGLTLPPGGFRSPEGFQSTADIALRLLP